MTNFLEHVISDIVFIPFGQYQSKVLPLWECDDLIERYRLLHKWYTLGYIEPDASALESTATRTDFPVRFGVAWRGYQGYSNPDKWGFTVKTSIFDGPYISRATEQGAMTAICAACTEERAKAALRYIELLNTDRKFRDILAYGIEGKHFNYLENGTVMRTAAGNDRYTLNLYQTGSVVNASVETVRKSLPADPGQWTKVYEGYKEYGIKSCTDGFVYDRKRREDIIAALSAVYRNYATDLQTGTSDPDAVIPKMKAEMEAVGINELIADIQECLDRHLALSSEPDYPLKQRRDISCLNGKCHG